jgi:glycosyltransferase involved in cell wall biosynthesis
MVDRVSEQMVPIIEIAEAAERRPALSVVIPAYNEGPAIGPTLEAVLDLARDHQWEVIVVDDGSSDNTAEQVQQLVDDHYLKLVRHPYNRGYGAALKTGIRVSTAHLIATMDSDGQHDAQDLVSLLPFAEDYELVVGQRPGMIHSRASRMPGKWVLGWLANYLTNRKIPDLNSGMRLFHADVIRRYLHLCPDGFSFSTTSTLVFFNRGYTVTYVPITIRRRHQEVKSTVTLSAGFDALVLILRIASLFQPLRVYIPASILFIVLGILWGFPYMLLQQGVSVGALLLFITGLLLFFFGLLSDQVAQLRLEKYE